MRLIFKSKGEPLYRSSFGERFGYFKGKKPGRYLWIHAVSVGEVVAAFPLIRNLVNRGYPCLVTSATPAGKQRIEQLLGDEVEKCFVPLDLAIAVKRFISSNMPLALIMVETELWPNIIAECKKKGVKIFLVNGRMSKASAKTYHKVSFLTASMFEKIDFCGVQTVRHRNRFVSLGVRKDQIEITGNLKFDIPLPDTNSGGVEEARALVGERPVLLGASTHEGEEVMLLQAFKKVREKLPNLLLILAPRHLNRLEQIVSLISDCRLNPAILSQTSRIVPTDDLLLIDKMGVLPTFYCCAQVAFVGGSMVPLGGHNLLEGVRAGCAVIMGPFVENIEDIAREFETNGAMSLVLDQLELEAEIYNILNDQQKRENLVSAASDILTSNSGALRMTESMILEHLDR